MRSSVQLLFSIHVTELEVTEGVHAHEWSLFTGLCANPHRDAREGLRRDVPVLKWVELPRLLLPVATLDLEDAHQHLVRVSHNLVIDEIPVDLEHFPISTLDGTIPRSPRWRKIETLAGYLHLLREHSKLLEQILVE